MPARTGKEFLAKLKGVREIWLGDEKISDVADHPAFAGAAQAVAGLYDLQYTHAADCLMPDPETGELINVSHLVPHSKEDVLRRHAALQHAAEYSVGLMGRSPDYMNVTYAGFAGRVDEWRGAPSGAAHGGGTGGGSGGGTGGGSNEAGAERLLSYQKFLGRNDVSLTHTIVQPTVDKAKGDAPQAGDDVALHRVGATEHGIIVRGARVLATLAPFADEIAVYPGAPLPPGADDYALAFCIPMNTPGLKFICRDSTSRKGNLFDHPLSARFDEQDAFVIFDNVEVPHERVHINGDLNVYNNVMRTSWMPNIMQQTMIRAQTKLEFAWGLATRMSEAINGVQPPTAQMLGELWTFAEFARACVSAAENGAYEYGNGAWFPDGRPLYALRATLPTWMPRVNEIIRLLGSHNFLAAPTLAQLNDPALGPLVNRYLRGAGDVSARDRARVFRLAWDFTGSALASRNEQYERFYLASGARNYMFAHMGADRTRANQLVDRFLLEDIA